MRKRKANMFALLLTGILALSACGNGSQSVDVDTVRDTIIIATENETPSMHLYDHNAVAADYMNKLTHNGLLRPGMNLIPELDLAEDYVNLSDTEWLFTLKQGVLFHDGTELTSKDVEASFIYNKNYPQIQQFTQSIKEVEIIDDYNFIIHTDGIQASLLTDLSHHSNFIYPAHLIESGADLGREVIGTGPYKFVQWNRGDSIVFEAFENYFDGGEVAIKNMIWRIIPEGASRTIALETGEVDVIIEVAQTDVLNLKANDRIELIEISPGTSHNFIMINNELAPFDNVLVRKAIAAAINKEDIITVALEGMGIPTASSSPLTFAAQSTGNFVPHDLELAQQYLDESGVDPATIDFKLICSNDLRRRMGESIQANLAQIGISVDIVSMDLAAYLEATSSGDYVAAIGGFTADNMLGYMKGVHHSNSINGSNRSRLNDPEVDRLIDLAIETIDVDLRDEYLSQAATRVDELTPTIPLYHENVIRAHVNNLGGFQVSAAGYIPWRFVYWE